MKSKYVRLKRIRIVTAPTTLLHATIKLGHRDSVFVQTDGTYRPRNTTSAADVYITIDGRKVSDDSLADWRSSEQLDAHPFDVMGSVSLISGRHTIALRAKPPLLAPCVYDVCPSLTDGGKTRTGGFDVLGANLSVFVHPAATVTSQRLSSDAGPFNFDTTGYFTTDTHLTKPLPIAPLLSTDVVAGQSAVALGSGWLFANGGTGDAMLTMLLDGSFPGDDVSSWGDSDLWFDAELRAPESVQEFVAPSDAEREVSLGTIEFPWMPAWGAADDPVVYSVAAGTNMTVMSGGLSIAGVAGGSSDTSPDPQPPALIGGSQEGVPTGKRVLLTSARVNVPRRNPGVVFFSAKAMDQGGGSFDGPPSRGTLSLFMTIDGKRVGPRTRQEVSVPDDGSGATIATSYLATGRAHLHPGRHLIQVWGRADGPFRQAWMFPEADLTWFD